MGTCRDLLEQMGQSITRQPQPVPSATEFVPNMGVTHGIQKSATLGELAQRGQPRLGEEGSRHAPVRLDLYQTAGIMVWIAGGSFGLLAKDPPRQIRRNMPSATEGKLPKC